MTVLDHSTVRNTDLYIDDHHHEFAQLGEQLYAVFAYDTKNNRINSQIRNLQQVACSATRFADIEDFVKNQMGKSSNKEWKQVGDQVLQQLSQLRAQSADLSSNQNDQMTVRLKLARGWVRAVVSEYLYRVALAQMEVQA